MEISLAKEKIEQFNKFIVAEYLKYGSVDEVFWRNNYDLPISYPEVHRLIKRWGIIKSAGPNSILSEAITFLTLLSQQRIPLETLYKRLPPSFKTSMGTMHRLLHNIKEGIIRRVGTALIISPRENLNLALVGNDVSTPRLELGKPFGSTTLPMGYAKEDENPRDSILRVLQSEVFTQMAIEQTLPMEIIPPKPKPLMFVDIADIRVSVYQVKLPEELGRSCNFASFKVQNHRYLRAVELTNGGEEYNFRAGIKEIGAGYQEYLEKYTEGALVEPITARCFLNRELALAWAEQLAA
jgi:hypothetical protein